MFRLLVGIWLFLVGVRARRRTITTETSRFFKKLKDFDLVHFDHSHSKHLFHHWEKRFYPVQGEVKFDAFGQHYHLKLDKNQALFGEDFKVIGFNGTHRLDMGFDHVNHNCFYQGEVINDENPSTVAVSTCQGNGVSGLIIGHGRTIAIKPSQPHVDINNDQTPTVHDEHLVYHIDDVHRHETGHLPSDCQVGHEMDEVPHHMENLREHNPDMYDHIIEHHVNGHKHEHDHDHDHEHSHEHEPEHEHSHEHEHEHKHKHDEEHDHDHEHGDDEHDDLAEQVSKYHQRISKILNTPPPERRNLQSVDRSKQRYVEMLLVNDPARTLAHWNCEPYDVDGTFIPNNCYNLLVDTLAIFNVVTGIYRSQSWEYNIQLVVTSVENWWSHDCVIVDGTPANSNYCDEESEMRTLPPPVMSYRSSSPGSYSCTATVNALSVNRGEGPSYFKEDAARDNKNGYCEASYVDYLSKWHDWRLQSNVAPYSDNAQLLSYYDFYSTVIGYATLKSLCASYSGGINQMTYDQEYNAGIIAHEMGHNFGMRHDSDGNSCSASSFIMASTGSPNGARPKSFSSCSVDYLDEFFASNANRLVCLDNEPLPPVYAVCGNGFLEQGEQCDCGTSDCTGIDDCCDGSICALRTGNKCSSLQPCCDESCQLITEESQIVCRTKSDANTCDKSVEYCDGVNPECPLDLFFVAGDSCYVPGVGTDNNRDGACFNGACASAASYCAQQAGLTHCSAIDKLVNYCDEVYCEDTFGNCLPQDFTSNGETGFWPDGTPCKRNPEGPSGTESGLCFMEHGGSSCNPYDEMYSFQWWADPWNECSANCYPSHCNYDGSDSCSAAGCEWVSGACNRPDPGSQTRDVYCIMKNGTRVHDDLCLGQTKFNTESNCNQFPCGNCDLDCGEGGYCTYETATNSSFSASTSTETCVCLYGYTADACAVGPSITFGGLTSKKGYLQSLDAEPYCKAQVDDEYCGSDIFTGDTVTMQWFTEGNPESFAVSIQRQGEEFAFYPEDDQLTVFTNKVSYVDINGDTQDCNNATDPNYGAYCDDASIYFNPSLNYLGNYSLIIRFNNEANTETPMLTIQCNPDICNSTGHGTCASRTGQCACDEFYTGVKCQPKFCKDWSFINESLSGSEVTDSSYSVPHCFGYGTCEENTGTCTCDTGYSGEYCEVSETDVSTCSDVEFSTPCKNGAVRVLGSQGSCDWSCDCDAVYRQGGARASWTGDFCDQCGIMCMNGGAVDAGCTECSGCDTAWLGDRCQFLQWIANFDISVAYDVINSVEKEQFTATILKDITYALNDPEFPESRFSVYALRPDGSRTKVYFSIIFDANSPSESQAIGGNIMSRLKALVVQPRSAWYRGMLTGYTVSTLSDHCDPYWENCDPDLEDHFQEYFLYCLGGSFVFQVLVIIIWWQWNKKARFEAYQERVKKVADRLKKLQQSNEQQGGRQYFKLKPVKRRRARQIYLANKEREVREVAIKKEEEEHKKEVEQKKKLKKKEEKERKKREKNQEMAAPAPGSEGQEYAVPGASGPGYSNYQQPGSSSAPAAPGSMYQPGKHPKLPKGWIEYKSKNGIPYYYNKKTKQSVWEHPGMKQQFR